MSHPRAYLALIPIRAGGIPALAGVTFYEPFRPGRKTGPWENCYPDEGPDIEWEVCTTKGRPSDWLAGRLSKADTAAITRALLDRAGSESVEPIL